MQLKGSLSLPPSLPLSISVSVCLSVCLSVSLSLSLSLSLCLCCCLFLCLNLLSPVSVSLPSLSLALFSLISLFFFLFLSPFLFFLSWQVTFQHLHQHTAGDWWELESDLLRKDGVLGSWLNGDLVPSGETLALQAAFQLMTGVPHDRVWHSWRRSGMEAVCCIVQGLAHHQQDMYLTLKATGSHCSLWLLTVLLALSLIL